MTTSGVPVPQPMNIRDGNVAENWRRFETAWSFYEIATEIDKKNQNVRVAALLSVIGQDAVEVYQTFEWDRDADKFKIKEVLDKFKQYCIPRSNVLFETYRFSTRKQEADEPIDRYITVLRRLADACEFSDKDRRIRDQVVLGMRDSSVRERILRSPDPDLSKVIQIIRASETAEEQSKMIKEEKDQSEDVHKVNSRSTGQRQKRNFRTKEDKSTSAERKFQCKRCGGLHEPKKCPAWGQECNKCKGKNHFAKCCTTEEETAGTQMVTVEKKIYSVNGKSKTKTFTVFGSRKKVTFQIDTGAEVNVLPFTKYKELTGDEAGRKLEAEELVLVMYGGNKKKSLGSYNLPLFLRGKKTVIKVTVADVTASPLLSRSTSEKLNLVKFLDCDQIPQPILQVKVTKGISKEEILKKYNDVFTGIGKLEGEYDITMDESVKPVVHAPRRVPVAVRDELKELLSQMETDGIIKKVTKPTQWVSSLMLKKEPNKLRICLDPQDLNKAIQREHHPLPTVEEVTSRIQGARVFSVMDARKGFWHKVLSKKSSYLTTFNTPFGRYRWLRMPFGLKSAPEVFQRAMMEFAEDLEGVEVVADDFLILGFGATDEDAIADHDKNLIKFLEKARVKNLKLNGEKMKLKMEEVPFIGHILSKEGVKVDPKKVKAITEMPIPKDEKDLRRFLGMVQYLAKFLPRLSEMTKPLRELTLIDAEWKWKPSHGRVYQSIKDALTKAPILVYYDMKKEVTIQGDASQGGLGAVLLQEGKPVVFTSRAMTKTEQRYAQIEKEMLAILHACTKFDQYIYGRTTVKVETDHKPLETIFKKPIDTCPKRLQRMLLALQRYSLNVVYKRGKELYIADTLSRAYLPEEESTEQCDILEVREKELALGIQAVTAIDEVPNSERRTEEIRVATKEDPVLQQVIKFVQNGWPDGRKEVDAVLKPYYDIQTELTEETGLLFKGTRVVIPSSQRKEVMNTFAMLFTSRNSLIPFYALFFVCFAKSVDKDISVFATFPGISSAKTKSLQSIPWTVCKHDQSVTQSVSKQDYRLPKSVKPIHYNIKLLPIPVNDSINAPLYSSPGEVDIFVECLESVNQITIHSTGTKINESLTQVILVHTGEQIDVTGHEYDNAREFYIISLERPLESGRLYQLKIAFESEVSLVRKDGMFRSQYFDPIHNSTKYLAVTQFAPISARRCFPCFDEPQLVASFNVTIGRHAKFTSTSNAPWTHTEAIDGMKDWFWDHFLQTVPMPTYLLAFIVSDYGSVENDPNYYKKPIRTLAPDFIIKNGYGNYSVNLAARILETYENLFKIEYPMEKMDLAAVYDLKYAAMENYGLITFLPSNLYYYRNDTEDVRFQASLVIAHELAHQYFGNLVVAEWWTGTWLKEGFATYFSYIGMNAVNPEFNPLYLLVTNTKQVVMEIDVMNQAQPVQFPDKENPSETLNFDSVIMYLKGASLIRMMEDFLGWKLLLEGLQQYLTRYSHKPVNQNQLFETLTEVAITAQILPQNLTITEIMEEWTLQSNYPVVLVRRDSDLNHVIVSQTSFGISNCSMSEWKIPLKILQEGCENMTRSWLLPNNDLLLNHTSSECIIVNAEAMGYYRVVYDKDLTSQIIRQLDSNHQLIPPSGRSQLIDDYFSMAYNTDLVEIEEALFMTKHLSQELHYAAWIPTLKHMKTPMLFFSGLSSIVSMQVYWSSKIETVINSIGLNQSIEEKGTSVLFRKDLLNFSCLLEIDFCVHHAIEMFTTWLNNPLQNNIPSDLRAIVYCTGVRNGPPGGFQFVYEQFHAENSNPSHSSLLMEGLICSSNATDLYRLLHDFFTTSNLGADQITSVLAKLAAKPVGREVLLKFFEENYATVVDFFDGPIIIAAIVYEISTYYCTDDQLVIFQEFVERNSAIFMDPAVSWVIDLAFEAITGNIHWMEKFGDRILTWFSSNI